MDRILQPRHLSAWKKMVGRFWPQEPRFPWLRLAMPGNLIKQETEHEVKLLWIWVATVNHIYCTHHLYNHPVCRHTWNARLGSWGSRRRTQHSGLQNKTCCPRPKSFEIPAAQKKSLKSALGGWNQGLSISHLRPKAPRSIRVKDEAVVLCNKKRSWHFSNRELWQLDNKSAPKHLNWQYWMTWVQLEFASVLSGEGSVLTKGIQEFQSPLVHLLQWTKKDMPNNWLED